MDIQQMRVYIWMTRICIPENQDWPVSWYNWLLRERESERLSAECGRQPEGNPLCAQPSRHSHFKRFKVGPSSGKGRNCNCYCWEPPLSPHCDSSVSVTLPIESTTGSCFSAIECAWQSEPLNLLVPYVAHRWPDHQPAGGFWPRQYRANLWAHQDGRQCQNLWKEKGFELGKHRR